MSEVCSWWWVEGVENGVKEQFSDWKEIIESEN